MGKAKYRVRLKQTHSDGGLTRDECISLNVFFAALCQEYIGFVEKQNTVPLLG